MEKFKDVVMKLSENASPDLKILIQEHLNKFTSGFHTPDHPPYAAVSNAYIHTIHVWVLVFMILFYILFS